MKSILISIRPEWVAKILNGEKKIEIRRSKPKRELPIDVYIYCTKSSEHRLERWDSDGRYFCFGAKSKIYRAFGLSKNPSDWRFNGKVVGKFRLEKVDCLRFGWERNPYFSGIGSATRLSVEETKEYLNGKTGYLWHISDLEIFDEPIPLAALGAESAPQSWAYIESDRDPIYARNGRCEAYCDGKLIGGNHILHITMNGSEIMHQKWAVMPTKAQAEEILSALNPEGI